MNRQNVREKKRVIKLDIIREKIKQKKVIASKLKNQKNNSFLTKSLYIIVIFSKPTLTRKK